MIRFGLRPGHVGGLAAPEPEAAAWLVQTLVDSGNEIQTNGAFSDEAYACSARCGIARTASMAARAGIESEEK